MPGNGLTLLGRREALRAPLCSAQHWHRLPALTPEGEAKANPLDFSHKQQSVAESEQLACECCTP